MTRTAFAIRHVAFEDLGLLAPVLAEAGYGIRIADAGGGPLPAEADSADLLIVLGGPLGAYEADRYPFLADERRLLDSRLAAGQPTLGICLGAQLMAMALGARVYPGGKKEIGWSPLNLTAAGRAGPLKALEGVPVLHWHGDTFDLPPNAVLLAGSDVYPHQAFAIGQTILGLQFHGEADGARIEPWLIGHACEIAAAGIDPRDLRAASLRHAAGLREAGAVLFRTWLRGLEA